MKPIQYLHSDAWVLLAIILSGKDRGADIADIISTADYINHAILCYEELDGALMRLTLGNYIFEENARFYPSRKITEQYGRNAAKGKLRIDTTLEDISKLIGAEAWSKSVDPYQANEFHSYGRVDRDAFSRTVQTYLNRYSK
ncbi:MAG: hypothetical protein ACOY0R_16205 [Chloroflexota bacterium]